MELTVRLYKFAVDKRTKKWGKYTFSAGKIHDIFRSRLDHSSTLLARIKGCATKMKKKGKNKYTNKKNITFPLSLKWYTADTDLGFAIHGTKKLHITMKKTKEKIGKRHKYSIKLYLYDDYDFKNQVGKSYKSKLFNFVNNEYGYKLQELGYLKPFHISFKCSLTSRYY